MEADVGRKIEALFPDPLVRDRVRDELQKYGQETYEREAGRVRLAILKLCEGRSERVSELVGAAKRDYRDVLMWAESPAEGQALWALRSPLSEEEQQRLAALRKEDRERYKDWLEE